MLSLTVLGSGTGIPSLKRCGPSYLLRVGGATALVDCGYGALHQLLRLGHEPAGLDAVFITHAHPDHICDLLALLQSQYLAKRSKLLQVFGPPGFRELCRRSFLSLTMVPTSYELRITDVTAAAAAAADDADADADAADDEGFTWADCRVLTIPTVHSRRLASIAYRFEYRSQARRRALVFSGDTDVGSGLSTFARAAKLLVLDCSYPDGGKVEGHLTAGECGRLAARAGVEQVLLTHIYPSEEPDQLRIEQCRVHYSGSVLLAADLMELQL